MRSNLFLCSRAKGIICRTVLALFGCTLLPGNALAGAGLPWESQLDKISSSLSGPVAKAVGLIAMVLCGIGIGLSEGGSGARKLLIIGLGLSIAFSARTFWLSFFGSSGGFVL